MDQFNDARHLTTPEFSSADVTLAHPGSIEIQDFHGDSELEEYHTADSDSAADDLFALPSTSREVPETAGIQRTMSREIGARAHPPKSRALSSTSARLDADQLAKEMEGGGQRLAEWRRMSSSDVPPPTEDVDEMLTARENHPLFRGGHVMEMVVNQAGVRTAVRRSQRNRETPE